VLVYLDGDNDLADAARADFQDIVDAPSVSGLNVLVQLDLPASSPGVPETTKRYRIRDGAAELLEDLGERDMSAPETLTDFIRWGAATAPAARTALLLWNHGNGWDELDAPSSPAPLSRAITGRTALPSRQSILLDTDSQGARARFLPNHQVKLAIRAAGVPLDVLGFDACAMATFEALYEFRDVAKVIVASEENVLSPGWPYAPLLRKVAFTPWLDAEGFARAAVGEYGRFYEELYPRMPMPDRRGTLSAFRADGLEPVAREVDALAGRLVAALADPATRDGTLALVGAARAGVQDIDLYGSVGVYVDLADLAERLEPGSSLPGLVAAARIAESHGSDRPGATVFFRMPDARTYGTFDPNYANWDAAAGTGNGGDFINAFRWDEFLAAYYAAAGL
jgi:hypothetical protein